MKVPTRSYKTIYNSFQKGDDTLLNVRPFLKDKLSLTTATEKHNDQLDRSSETEPSYTNVFACTIFHNYIIYEDNLKYRATLAEGRTWDRKAGQGIKTQHHWDMLRSQISSEDSHHPDSSPLVRAKKRGGDEKEHSQRVSCSTTSDIGERTDI